MTFRSLLLAAVFLTACQSPETDTPNPMPPTPAQNIVDYVEHKLSIGETPEYATELDALAAEFVQLALKFGQIDRDYVDAYSGPELWLETARTTVTDPIQFEKELLPEIIDLLNRVKSTPITADQKTRQSKIEKFLEAMVVRLEAIPTTARSKGKFDREVKMIYDVKPSAYDLSDYDKVLNSIDALVPGNGPLAERVASFKNLYAIPKDKLKPVFDRAIDECRARTKQHYDLPAGESFKMEFVTNKSWSGYNYYQGDYESLIQINTDFPITIDRAVDLGCHEGYPGHHVWNILIERELLGQRGWIEYSVNPLFGPFGPMAEGSGNYGIELAFPGEEKTKFETEVLYPLAGLDPAGASKLDELLGLEHKLKHATNEVARQYLDGEIDREAAIDLMQKYYLQSREKSEQRIRFVEKYRAYVINYNVGLDLVREYIEAAGDDPQTRWNAFERLLTTPMTASDIQQ